MEADWSVALAESDPAIVVPWADEAAKRGFIDLRLDAGRVDEIEEVKARPELRSALLLLNGAGSLLWTAKCDAWTTSSELGDEPFDPYEMEAEPEETAFGAGSYVDLVPREPATREHFAVQEQWLRAVTGSLRTLPARAARVDLVLRPALVDAIPGFGVTWFVEGCGSTALRADQRWNEAFQLALPVILDAYLWQLRPHAG